MSYPAASRGVSRIQNTGVSSQKKNLFFWGARQVKKIPKVPLIIGAIFAIALAVMIATTIALRKTELGFRVTQLEGKFKDRTGATFVGSETCKRCHERTYLEWRTSLHSRMMRDEKAEPLASIGDFESASDVRKFKKEDVHYTLGSQWKQQYLKKEGNDLIVLPAQYNVFTGEWKAYYPESPDARNWFKQCAGCHATGVDPEKKTFVEMGVACEACHGPGSNHVEAVPGYEIPTIIQASRLTPALAAQICGSCHTAGRDKTGKYAYPVNYQIHKGEANIRLYFNEASAANDVGSFLAKRGIEAQQPAVPGLEAERTCQSGCDLYHLPRCAQEQECPASRRGGAEPSGGDPLQDEAV